MLVRALIVSLGYLWFHEEEIPVGKLLAKNVARTARRQLDGRHLGICYLENTCKTEQPFIS